MIADVAFDAPLPPFSYRVPAAWTLAPGQRVLAPLRGAARVGVVVAVRDEPGERLRPLLRVLDAAPLLAPAQVELVRWIAAESVGSLGSAWLALLPPSAGEPASPHTDAAGAARPASPAVEPAGGPPSGLPEVLVGAGREARVLERIAAAAVPAVVLAPDVEAAARWAQRLEKLGRAGRLDSGAPEGARAQAWLGLRDGSLRLAAGTRSALLAPLPPGGLLALIDEHEAAHRPPGPPRIHARDVVLQRAACEGIRALLTSATPSVETWWRTAVDRARLDAPPRGPWPAVSIADARGIARREALTPPLARAIRETLAAGRRVFLVVSRLHAALGCDECGAILKCPACAIALAYSPAGRALACRLCGTVLGLPETCPVCRGRRLAPFGWGVERVEHAVRRRFARARIARYDPDAMRGRRAEAQRAAALAADVVIGTRGALRLFGPASLGLAGFVAPDQLLALPDFRAAERLFALLWAAAERVRPDGAVIVQSQNPAHPALAAVAGQDLPAFYGPELTFRAELRYPPFGRLALVTVRGPDATAADRLAGRIAAALQGSPLTAYPPRPDRRRRARHIVVKGGDDLPVRLGEALAAAGAEDARSRGIIDVEVDPVEWPS